ncbi:AAA family ATPase [Chelativorans intermedius]|uniref:AAA family ATPase n=1 Tax=Chelativorans intermedius TaxID=515947 RepID=A0ABV6D7V5_9HYPH|nr:AAA family ATPase [Chelativorans intermedius]MCT8999937.1 AAA family ATPase [Chelativorans intermedius]
MMPRYFLTRLRVEGFRGINNEGDPLELRFKPEAVNSVFALNGIGKSSLFEALSYAIHDIVPKLRDLQAQERPQDYFGNRFHGGNEAVIELEFQPDDGGAAVSIEVRRDKFGNRTDSSASGHPDPSAFLVSLRETFALLDYRNFARFIDDSPLARGRTFSSLLGLAEYSERRQALQAVSETRSLNSDLDMKVLSTGIGAAEKAGQQALALLRSSYENVTGGPLEDVEKLESYAGDVVAALAGVELLKPMLAGKTLDQVDFDAVKQAIKTAEGGERRRELERAVEAIATLSALSVHNLTAIKSEQEALASLVAQRDAALAETRGDLFKRLYDAGMNVFSDDSWTNDTLCPLCETEPGFSVRDHVSGQLAQYRAAAAKASEISDAWAASAWKQALGAYEKCAALDIDEESRRQFRLDDRFASGDITAEEFKATVGWTTGLFEKAASNLSKASEAKAKLEAELPQSLVQLTEQVEHGRQFSEALKSYRQQEAEAARMQARLDIRERWKTFITAAAGTFADAEAALSRDRIAKIDGEYKWMFRDIMQVGDVVPDLKRADDREDLHVELSDFHGQRRLSARALLSESYRNALAISVFLAAAMKHNGQPRFIVLDDVTSSFDAGHQFYLMELIRAKLQQPVNPDGLQFILLSHDSLLEKYFDRLGGTTGWHHCKLQGSPPMGAILSQGQGADRLRQSISNLLSAGQTTQAEPLIRQYLEYSLQQIIRKVDIPVPIDFAIKDTSRMVQNCIDAIMAAVDLHEKAGTIKLDQQQIRDIQNVHMPAIVGNWVSHYQTGGGSSFSAPVLNGVLASVDNLAECFRYDDTSGATTVRRWYRSLSHK